MHLSINLNGIWMRSLILAFPCCAQCNYSCFKAGKTSALLLCIQRRILDSEEKTDFNSFIVQHSAHDFCSCCLNQSHGFSLSNDLKPPYLEFVYCVCLENDAILAPQDTACASNKKKEEIPPVYILASCTEGCLRRKWPVMTWSDLDSLENRLLNYL